MAGENKNQRNSGTRRKKRRLPGIVFSFITLGALIYIAMILLSGREIDFTGITSPFRSRTPVEMAEEFNFDVGGARGGGEGGRYGDLHGDVDKPDGKYGDECWC